LDAPKEVKQGYTLWVNATLVPSEASGGYERCKPTQDKVYVRLGTQASYPLYQRSKTLWQGAVPVHIVATVGRTPLVLDTHAKPSQGNRLASAMIQVTSGGYAIQNIGLTKGMSKLSLSDTETNLIQSHRRSASEERYFGSLPPWKAPVRECISGVFGDLRYHNGKFSGSFHRGMDHLSGMGVPIIAPSDGVVKLARKLPYHGGTVLLDHGHGITSIYIHQSAILVQEGTRITAGTPLGKVGDSGFATGPHLHWGVFVHGEPVNPIQWITPKSSVCSR
jgi:hypothetical protein